MNLTHPVTRGLKRTCRALTALGVLAAAPAAIASDWTWSVTPYIWTTDVGADLAIDDRQVVDEQIAFTDLIDDIDTVAQVQLEGRHGAHGVLFDFFDVTLSEPARRVDSPHGGAHAVVAPEIGMTILDLAGTYDRDGDRQGLEWLYGARVIDQRLNLEVLFVPETGDSSASAYEAGETLVDALVGVRYTRRLASRWSWQMRADVSTGGTELTWSVGPTLSYAFGKDGRYALSAGYRRMDVEFDTEETMSATMSLSGALIGFRFAF